VKQISGPSINASYSYNGLDTRVGKTENSVSNTFRRSGAYVTDPVLSDGTASYTPGVPRRTGTETRYFHTGLKNTDSLTNPGQTVAASRIYDAFGNVVSSSGTWSGPFGYAGNFGYQQDASGLKLLGHRYYDPSTGRFLTRDPIKDGRNWYAYGAGEAAPTMMADPTGLRYYLIIAIEPGNGHVRVGLWDSHLQSEPQWFGFYPNGAQIERKKPSRQAKIYVTQLRKDTYNRVRRKIAEQVRNRGDYNLRLNNCTHFAIDIMLEAGFRAENNDFGTNGSPKGLRSWFRNDDSQLWSQSPPTDRGDKNWDRFTTEERSRKSSGS
jgi:RHS repeat-associated protein